MNHHLVPFEDSADSWQKALHAFLAEKERRSGSRRTVDAYHGMLQYFFGSLGKTPDEVDEQDVFSYAHGIGLSGRKPSSATIGARIACVSSFYRFLIRMKVLTTNPCDQLQRPKCPPAQARGLNADQIKKLLSIIPETPSGLRDKAIILTLTLTGRRRSEVLNLRAGDISLEGSIFYSYRGKGGKTGKRELPRPAFEAIETELAAFGKDLAAMKPEESLWPSCSHRPEGLTNPAFYSNFRKYLAKAGLPLAGVHILRHSAAKLRRDVGETIEEVSRFLDHSSLAVTTVYLRRLEGQEDKGWGKVAEAIGV